MDKRYQVFVSSTYADLKEERQQVIQALMEMDCIPSGMELFPAADEEQWEFIKRVIDDCDYYLLIIGGRYGSTTADGISYTEKEFDYAVGQGLKVVALLHGEPGEISVSKTDENPELREKLNSFRKKVMDGRLVKFWIAAKDLPGLVALSLSKTIKTYPAVGWVRANQVASENLLQEMNELRKENNELSKKLGELDAQPKIEDIAAVDAKFTIHGTHRVEIGNSYGGKRHTVKKSWKIELSWREIFSLISPYLLEHPSSSKVKSTLENTLQERDGLGNLNSMNDQDFKTITLQLVAYGLVSTKYSKTTDGGTALFWRLTKKGEQFMMENRVVRQATTVEG